jgi:hypothetical protein
MDKWRGDYMEEYTTKFRPNYVTLFSQLIIHLCSSIGNMNLVPRLYATSLCRLFHMSTYEGATWHCMDYDYPC